MKYCHPQYKYKQNIPIKDLQYWKDTRNMYNDNILDYAHGAGILEYP